MTKENKGDTNRTILVSNIFLIKLRFTIMITVKTTDAKGQEIELRIQYYNSNYIVRVGNEQIANVNCELEDAIVYAKKIICKYQMSFS